MLLFLFASLSVFLLLHDVPKKIVLVNQNGVGKAQAPLTDGTEFAKRQTFFFHHNKRFVFTLLSSIELNSLLYFFFCV